MGISLSRPDEWRRPCCATHAPAVILHFGLGIHRGHERHMRHRKFAIPMTADHLGLRAPMSNASKSGAASAGQIFPGRGPARKFRQNHPSPSLHTPISHATRRAAYKNSVVLIPTRRIPSPQRDAVGAARPLAKTIAHRLWHAAPSDVVAVHRKVRPNNCRDGRPFGNAACKRLEIASADREPTIAPVRQSVESPPRKHRDRKSVHRGIICVRCPGHAAVNTKPIRWGRRGLFSSSQ